MGFLGLSGAKLYIFLGMILAIVMLASADAVLWSRLDVKDARITSLEDQLKLAAGDVVRWQTSANQNLQVVRRQAEQLRRLESDGSVAQAVSEQKQDRAQQRITTLEAQVLALKGKAREHPEDVRDLGPIVRDALPSLRH
jgi:TolA-binding protein